MGADVSSFNVHYDRGGDVLYISSSIEPAHRAVQDNSGIIWRYAVDGSLIGATILDYRDRRHTEADVLAGELSRRFGIAGTDAAFLVRYAVHMDRP